MKAIQHIHHISAIVGNPEENIAFYRDILNLRLIKKTVNYDDPGTYHLYFSNNDVDNGTILTFFNWPNEHVGHTGAGQIGTIAFRIPKDTLEVWKDHLTRNDITVEVTSLFGQATIQFKDVHGLSLALVEDDKAQATHDIIGFHGVTMLTENPTATAETLVEDMGLEHLNEDSNYMHLATVGEWRHHIMIKKEAPTNRVRFGVGVVHHIAWSVPNIQAHNVWREKMISKGYHVTEVKDRNYFKAIYMRERGGIIFEFATIGPGFTIDEPIDKLGEKLIIPPQYEDSRESLLRQLPPIRI